jgi:xylose isomerase
MCARARTLSGRKSAKASALRKKSPGSVHLNDQKGMKYNQDKAFGVENLRQAFNQIKILVENNYGSYGEYIGLDVKAMHTQRDDACYKHLENSLKIAKMLEEKARKFDYITRDQCVAARDYEALEMYVMELLMKG